MRGYLEATNKRICADIPHGKDRVQELPAMFIK